MEALVKNPSRKNWKEIIPHREDVLIEDLDAFKDFLVIYEKQGGLKKIRIRSLKSADEHYVTFPEPLYDIATEGNREFDSSILRFAYESIITPTSVFDYHMDTRERTLLKEDEVKNYDRTQFITERIYAPARDGKAIPISLAYRKDKRLDGTSPLYLNGYGAYGLGYDPSFSPHRLSLLQRGFVYAIAHIRGGDDLGRQWYKDGRLLKKKNTFHDFISAASCLLKENYTSPAKLVISGRSAGGLLIGAVLNMKPGLFGIAIAGVPFVDALNTMLDPTLPLTIAEYDEWGNPQKKRYYDYIKSYSPYDNIAHRNYPHILVMTALNDSRVMFWEPLKWTAKLREYKRNDKVLLLKTNLKAGHGGASGRYDYIREIAFEYSFIFKILGNEASLQ
jgi:oligopeptidase B